MMKFKPTLLKVDACLDRARGNLMGSIRVLYLISIYSRLLGVYTDRDYVTKLAESIINVLAFT